MGRVIDEMNYQPRTCATKVRTWRVTVKLDMGVEWTQEVRAAYRDTAITKVKRTLKRHDLKVRHMIDASPVAMT